MIHWLAGEADPLPAARRALGPDSDLPGLVAAGGELTTGRLREAYSKGIFPWYSEGQPVLWWSPDPRMVLLPAEFKLSRSLKKTLRRFAASPACELRIDSAFGRVIRACSSAPREGQDGTWIVAGMIEAYGRWHAEEAAVHSFETWIDGELVGGLYGVGLGHVFFGESMFARRPDASKIALAGLVAFCLHNRIETIDCQQRTGHLASLGGRELPRAEFERRLQAGLGTHRAIDWTYDLRMWSHLGVTTPAPAEGAAP